MELIGVRMPQEPWTLEELIDFEAELMRGGVPDAELRQEVAAATRGLEGIAARRRGLKVWLKRTRDDAPTQLAATGRRVTGAFGLATTLCFLTLFLTGAGAVAGMVDRGLGGIHVTLALAVLLGTQWLVLGAGMLGWLWHRRAGAAFSAAQVLLGAVVRRLSRTREGGWWTQLVDGGGHARAALLWRLARLAQSAGIGFNLGVLAGLAGIVLVRNTGFFWETTTTGAMRAGLERTVGFLSMPWASWWPEAVPDAAVIEATRRLPEHAGALPPGPAQWWLFLLTAVAVWGLLPRLVLWLLCWNAGRRALDKLDFQGRAHRALWRELTSAAREDADEKPLDGVLVLDVGGTGLDQGALRPFLLRRLRVSPTAWESVAVLDDGAELLASQALANAPAGVVLLAEGWALSPPRMTAVLARVRAAAGPGKPVKFLAANAGPAGQPLPPTPDERREWERFTDSLRDPLAEVFCYEESPPA